eukprot:SAG25_NODE_10492_length_332_cov_0.442060_1_plen_49_part_01
MPDLVRVAVMLYTIHLRPGVAVAGNSLITVGANRIIDCIAYMPAEMTVQ